MMIETSRLKPLASRADDGDSIQLGENFSNLTRIKIFGELGEIKSIAHAQGSLPLTVTCGSRPHYNWQTRYGQATAHRNAATARQTHPLPIG